MTAKAESAVSSFVETARALIVVQLLVAILAIGAAIAATVKISEAVRVRTAAEIATATLAAERARTEEALRRYGVLSISVRKLSQASQPEEYAAVAEELQSAVITSSEQDENVYALLAAAQYRSPPPPDDTGATPFVQAAASITQAIELNRTRLQNPTTRAGRAELNETLYLDRAAYLCAAARASRQPLTYGDALDVVLASLRDLPPSVREVLSSERRVRTHPALNRECSEILGQIEQTVGGTEDVQVPENLYEIGLVYLQIRREGDRALAQQIGAGLMASGYDAPGVELIDNDYGPGVRYYYPDQEAQARRIAELVLATAQAQGRSWTAEDLPVDRISGREGLPRDLAEIWLPSTEGAQAGAAAELSDLGEVSYYQRGGDGLSVLSVLQGRIPSDRLTVAAPQVSGDRVNGIFCHPGLSGPALEQFKALTLALIDGGVPISVMGSFDDERKPLTSVEIVHAPRAVAARTLRREEIEALTACPEEILAFAQ